MKARPVALLVCAVLALGLAVVGVVLAPKPEPAFDPEALARKHGWHVVGSGDGRSGVFLTVTPRTWEELNPLSRTPERLDRWKGVVLIEPGMKGSSHAIDSGSHVSWLPDGTMLFGDPDMVGIVRRELRGR